MFELLRPAAVFCILLAITTGARAASLFPEPSFQPPGSAAETAAPGLVRGRIAAEGSGRPLQNVMVALVRGSRKIWGKTDVEGVFEIEAPAGFYAIEMQTPGFEKGFAHGFEVSAGLVQEAGFVLYKSSADAASAMEEVVVKGSYDPTGAARERWSKSVIDVLSAEDWSVSGDSSAVDALARMVGLTVVGGRYVYVRGLGERYSSTILNGASIPSPDPTRRVVPLDLFPTGILDSVNVTKTYAPNLPGDFSGGTVQLVTRSVPNEPGLNIGISLKDNDQLGSGLFPVGGDSDFWGFDDGFRDLPGVINQVSENGTRRLTSISSAEKQQVAGALNQDWDLKKRSFSVSPDIDISLHRRWDSEKQSFGLLFGGNFGNSWSKQSEDRRNFLFSGGELQSADESDLSQVANTVDASGLLQMNWDLGENHSFGSTSLLTRTTDKRSISEVGHLEENDIGFDQLTLEWVERELLTQQFTGSHYLAAWHLGWFYSRARATRDEPDTRSIRYDLIGDEPPALDLAVAQSNERSWEELADHSQDWGLDADWSFELGSGFAGNLKFGYSRNSKERDSSIRRFRYRDRSRGALDEVLSNPDPSQVFAHANLGQGLLELREGTLPTDNYTAYEQRDSIYVMTDMDIGLNWQLMFGLRREDSLQEVTTFRLSNPDQQIQARLDQADMLPTVTTTWSMNDSMQLRLGYSRTVNRPDLKELSEAPYIDPETRYTIEGNPELEIAKIANYDLRWEWYPGLDSMQVALFHKEFERPIEQVVRLGAGGIRSFANAETADVQGLEFQLSKGLGFAGDFLANWKLDLNAALIRSNVDTGEAGAQQTTNNRELQGQSPWVINLQLGYDDPVKDQQFTLLYNLAGERIFEVGTKGLPDAWEQPAGRLDLVYRRALTMNGLQGRLKVKLNNLLNPDHELLLDDEAMRSYSRGRSLSLGVDFSL